MPLFQEKAALPLELNYLTFTAFGVRPAFQEKCISLFATTHKSMRESTLVARLSFSCAFFEGLAFFEELEIGNRKAGATSMHEQRNNPNSYLLILLLVPLPNCAVL